MERDDAPSRRRLAQADVVDGAGAAEYADPPLPLPRVGGHRLEDVAAAAHLQYVRPERVGALPRDDDRRFRLVLRARWAAPRPARHHVVAGVVVVVGGEVVVFVGGIGWALEVEAIGALEVRNEVGS